MINTKKTAVFASLIAMAFLAAACGSGQEEMQTTEKAATAASTKNSVKALNFDDPYSNMFGVSAVLDDSLVYFNLKNSVIEFSRLYYDTNEIISIGTIEKYIFSQGYQVVIGDNIYFYITQAESEEAVFLHDEYTNLLCSINLTDNTLDIISQDSEYLPGAYTRACGNDLAIAQYKRNEDQSVTTFLEIADPATGERKAKSEEYLQIVEKESEETVVSGLYITKISTYRNKIYALLVDYSNGGYFINEYDSQLKLLRTIRADALTEEIASFGIWEFEVYSDFIFFHNGAQQGIFGTIENDTVNIKEVVDETYTYECTDDIMIPIFYTMNTSDVYLMNDDKKTCRKVELNLPDGFQLVCVIPGSNKNYVLIHDSYIQGTEHIYILDADSLESAVFEMPD